MLSGILIVIGGIVLCIGLGPWTEPTYATHWKDAYLISGGVALIAFGLRAAIRSSPDSEGKA